MTFLSFRVIKRRPIKHFSSVIISKLFWTRTSSTSSLGSKRTVMTNDINVGKKTAAYKAVDDWVKVNEEFKHILLL